MSYNASILDMVLHVITYRCHCPIQGLTRTRYIDANVLDVVLHENTFRNPKS
ncbi:Crumbs [Gossypium arboreum]|uniref:Crumbs n=1 Tax=Gossypium arboreum TaxID=29729 RepID=A0A0B0ND58_GOSAR|nr:Crumbs [Gossypium arboreum]